jgi:hypothetical protein
MAQQASGPAVATSDLDDWKGTERYEIKRRVGQGAMGVVYEAFDRERAQSVALKTLLHVAPAGLYMFKREFRTVADVRHTNLVHLYELVISDEAQPFFTMEFVDGVEFLDYVRKGNVQASAEGNSSPPSRERPQTPADLDRLRTALRQLTAGIEALHAAGKLHRDIKPSNVLVTPEGRVVLLDFGVSTELYAGSSGTPNESGEVVGTAKYMAPEQSDEAPLTTAASDWYSVGVMLYEALVGHAPFVGSVIEVLTMKSTVEAPRPSTLVSGVPEELDALCTALLSIEPEGRAGAAQIRRCLDDASGSSLAPVSSPPDAPEIFVGRGAQLGSLREAFEAARKGAAVTVRVKAESGFGKSAVVNRFLDELESNDLALVLRGRAYERELVPYKAVDAVIDTLSRHLIALEEAGALPKLPPNVGLLARVFPVLLRVSAIAGLAADGADAPGARRRAFVALRELLATMADEQPLVVLIDDAEWGDADSVELLVEVMRPPNDVPLLLVLTQREGTEKTAPFLVEMRSRWPTTADVRDVVIGPLEPGEARHLALSLLRDESELSRRIAGAVARESRGSPFLIEELARGNRGVLAARNDETPAIINLDRLVSDRFEHMPDDARRLVEIVAVAGRPLPFSIATRAAEVEGEARPAIEAAIAHRFVRAGLRDRRDVVEITQGRLRETILAQLSPSVLKELHGKLARVLEGSTDNDAEAVAAHWIGAGDPARAVLFAEKAAEQAEAKLALDQAARLVRFTLEHTTRGAPELHRRRVRLAELLRHANRHAESARAFLAAVETAPPEHRLELQRAAADQLLTSGHIDEGAEILHEVLGAAGLSAPRTPLSALFWLMMYRARLGAMGLSVPTRSPEQVAPSDRLRVEALLTASVGFGFVNGVIGTCVQARHLIEALRVGDSMQIVRAASLELAQMASQAKKVTPREKALERLARRLIGGDVASEGAAYLDVCLATGYYMQGRWRESRALLERWVNYRAPNGASLGNARLLLAGTCLMMGDLEEYARWTARLRSEAEDRGDLFVLAQLRTGFEVRVHLAEDNPERARQGIREALAGWTQKGFVLQHWQAMAYGADIELYEGKADVGYDRFMSQMPALKRSLLLHSGFIRATTWYTQGRLAIGSIAARPHTRRERIAEARRMATLLEREVAPWTGALAAFVRAAAENADGDKPAAIRALRAAIARSEATDSIVYLAPARYRLGELIGGEEGAEIVRAARAELVSWGMRNPDRSPNLALPGTWTT